MQERHFINKVHKKLPSSIYKWKINDAYHGGVPDCFYSGNGGLCFVEYKYKKELPKRDGTSICFNLNLSGANYGDLPNNSVGWAAVFIVSVHSLGGIDDYIWRNENP